MGPEPPVDARWAESGWPDEARGLRQVRGVLRGVGSKRFRREHPLNAPIVAFTSPTRGHGLRSARVDHARRTA